eukprot:205642-Rhodomonas_salina.1
MAARDRSGGGDDEAGWGVGSHAGPSHHCVAHHFAAPWSGCSPLQVPPSRAIAQHGNRGTNFYYHVKAVSSWTRVPPNLWTQTIVMRVHYTYPHTMGSGPAIQEDAVYLDARESLAQIFL